MTEGSEAEWWTPREAAENLPFVAETIRDWARKGFVESRRKTVGKRDDYLEVNAADAVRQAAQRHSRRRNASQADERSQNVADAQETPGLADRVTVLEEMTRRHWLIEELRDQIDECYRAIGEHQREIEALLLGPTTVPNN